MGLLDKVLGLSDKDVAKIADKVDKKIAREAEDVKDAKRK